MNRQLNEFIGVSENQTTNYNKDIVVTDLEGNQKIVIQCYCTIVANTSISHYMNVVDPMILNNYRELVQGEVEKFKAQALAIAKDNNVPLI